MCQAGYYNGSNGCVNCIPNCTSCINGTLCSAASCASGYVNSSDNSNCDECPDNCQSCTDSDNCTSSGCNIGYYFNSGSCDACPQNCGTCSDNLNCNECLEGYEFDDDDCIPHYNCSENCEICSDYDNCYICNEGSYLFEGFCQACSE